MDREGGEEPDRGSWEEQHHQLLAQNHSLKASLDCLKNILRGKLESALKKQK